jgi:hypothetical protein
MNQKFTPLLIAAALTTAVLFAASAAAGSSAGAPESAPPSVPAFQFGASFAAAPTGPPIVSVMPGHLSQPLRELPSAPPGEQRPAELVEPLGPLGVGSGIPDPVVQRNFGSGDMPAPDLTFDGLGQSDRAALGIGLGLPPDVEGDVGPSHYAAWINGVFAVYSKTGVLVAGFPKLGNAVWTGFGGLCETTNRGDPLVLYDQLADRWLLSQFAFSVNGSGVPIAPYFQCIAVSTSPDPTGSYCRYGFEVKAATFPDYGKVGLWLDGGGTQNAYMFSFAMFPDAGGFSPGAWAVERAMMLTAGCPAAQTVLFDSSNNAAIAGGALNRMLPADLDGTMLPPAGTDAPFAMHDDVGDQVEMYKFHVNWTTPALSTFTNTSNLGVPAFDTAFSCGASGRQCLPQPGTTNKIDALATRLMHRAGYRNFGTHQSLVFNQTVDADTDHAGVRWYEIRDPSGAPTVFQAATFAPDTDNRWMGSAAMDKQGNFAVGYSVASATTFPSIRYAGRLVTDAVNTLAQGEATLFAGSGSQTGAGFSTAGAGRWGDYTSMRVDPVDDCTFWYDNEYYPTTSAATYDTRIGKFHFTQCTNPTAVRVAGFAAKWRGRSIDVSWRTATEAALIGFNVYRSVGNGPMRKLNPTLIGTKRAGQARGAVYRLVDRNVRVGTLYTYRLQLVDSKGAKSWYGIGSAASGS